MLFRSSSKNKPKFVFPRAHFSDFICSLTGVSDLLASGTTDNFINFYKFNEENENIENINKIMVPGSINAMKFMNKGKILVCAQGVDQRLGRWITRTSVPIGITISSKYEIIAPAAIIPFRIFSTPNPFNDCVLNCLRSLS